MGLRRQEALAIALLLAHVACSRSAPREERSTGIVLCVASLPRPEWRRQALPSPQLVDALLATLSAAELAGITRAAEEAAQNWESKANPLVDWLDDEADPDHPMALWLRDAPDESAVALHALRGRYCADDGFCVQPARHRDCAAPFHAALPKELERAKFLAFPYAHAQSLAARPNLASTRRSRSRTSPHKFLVLEATPATPEPVLRAHAALTRYFATRDLAEAPRALGAAVLPDVPAPPPNADPDELLVLPSLPAALSPDAFKKQLAP